MNPVNRFLLYLLLLPSGVYRRMGVNIVHLRAILNAKLLMDDRRPGALQQTRGNREKKPPKLATLGTMFLSAVLGCIFLLSFGAGKDAVTNLTVYFAFYIFILASTLISDFTSVLIDVRDNMIILPKPVNDKTFVLARLLHIVIHVSKVVIPMSIPGMIYEGTTQGIGGLLPFIFCVLSATFFTIFLINAIYIVILQVTTPAKFKSIISYFQIVFAIIFYGGYQVVPRLIGKAAMESYTIEAASWKWLVFSYWYGASWEFMHSFRFTAPLVTAFLVTLLLPGLCMWLVIRFFAPSFNSKLSMISGGDGGEAVTLPETGIVKERTPKSPLIGTIAGWITRGGVERMSFLHTWKMTGRSREFKIKVYPSFGYLLVYVFVIFADTKRHSLSSMRGADGAGNFLFIGALYFSGFMMLVALGQIIFSDKYRAAWIYYITPVQKPGELISGAVKSMIIKFYLPFVIAIAVAATVIVGPSIIPNLLLGVCNQVLVIVCTAYITIRDLPFSVLQSNNAKGGNFIKAIFSLLLPAIVAIIHFILYKYVYVVVIVTVLSMIAVWLVTDAIKSRSWANIVQRNYE